jgi:hypothetical protein
MTIEKSYNRWAGSYDQDQNPTRDLDQHVAHDRLTRRKLLRMTSIGKFVATENECNG